MREIFEAIETYASAYSRMEQVQLARAGDLPRGDQKTGVIAEFYARIYARSRFIDSELQFGTTSEHIWDIKVVRDKGPPCLIQVKSVSAHAAKSRVSPLHAGWDELWLMRLDHNLYPEGFWIIARDDVAWSGRAVKSSTMPRRGIGKAGSRIYEGAADKLQDLLSAVDAVIGSSKPE